MGTQLRRNIAIAIPVLAASVVAILGIGRRSLWYDELQTSDAVINGVDGLLFHIWEAPRLPYYSVVFVWSIAGELSSDAWLRLPNAIGFVIAVGMTGATAWRLAGGKAAIVAGSFVAISIPLASLAQDAGGPYGLGAGLISTTTYLLVRSWTDSSRLLWIGYVFMVAMMLLIYPMGMAVLPVHLLLSWRSGNLIAARKRWLWGTLALVPAVGLEIFLFVKSGERMHGWVPTPAVGDFLEGFWWLGGSTALVLIFMAVLTKTGRIWLFGVFLIVLSTWMVSRIGASFWLMRTLIPFIGILAIGASFIARKLHWTGVGIFLAILGLVQVSPLVQQQLREDDRPWRHIVEFLAQQNPEQRTIVNSGWGEIGFAARHYVPEAEIKVYTWGTIPPVPYWTREPDESCLELAEEDLGPQAFLTWCEPR